MRKCEGLVNTPVFASSFSFASFKMGYQTFGTLVGHLYLCKGMLVINNMAFSRVAVFTLHN